jgi:tRNA-dihydrouridine synthase C
MTTAKSGRVPDELERLVGAHRSRPLLALAPMEGISDAIVRDLLSGLGGMDFCVTEFIRVTDRPVPKKVLLRECPELKFGGRTTAGVPVMLQLLGSDPENVGQSAARAVELGAVGIDLNFGCPARRVNGHHGGAALLTQLDRLRTIVETTRAYCPAGVPVSAKIRLGWENPEDVLDIARAAEDGGASWLTIHGRTKVQMYKPRAQWSWIRQAAARVKIPVIANGDIFTPDDLSACQKETQLHLFMIGRGAFRTPNAFRWMSGLDARPWNVHQSLDLIEIFVARVQADEATSDGGRVALGRLKGWIRALCDASPHISPLFHTVKRTVHLQAALECLKAFRSMPESFLNLGQPTAP